MAEIYRLTDNQLHRPPSPIGIARKNLMTDTSFVVDEWEFREMHGSLTDPYFEHDHTIYRQCLDLFDAVYSSLDARDRRVNEPIANCLIVEYTPLICTYIENVLKFQSLHARRAHSRQDIIRDRVVHAFGISFDK